MLRASERSGRRAERGFFLDLILFSLAIILVGVLVAWMTACSPSGPAKPDAKALESYVEASGSYAKGDFAVAAKLARKALGISPSFAAASVLLGKSLLFSGDLKGAVDALGGVYLADAGAKEAGIWYLRALRASKKDEDAEKLLERLLAGDGDDYRLLSLAATMRAESGDDAGARLFLDRAIDAAAGLGSSFIERARYEYTSGDAVSALADLGRAEALLPAGSQLGKSAIELAARIREKEGSK